jgi:hypothetical protein
MQSLKDAAQKEGIGMPITLRSFIQQYGTHSLRTLLAGVAIHRGEFTSTDLGNGYRLAKEGSSLHILTNDGLSVSSVKVPTDKLSSEQSKQALNDISKKIFEYFQTKFEDIKSGKIKAAEIGGAVYGIAAAVILAVYAPFAIAGKLLAQVFNFGFSVGAEQVGEYYGAIVDDFVAILKGEDNSSVSKIVGTMATVYFTQIVPVTPIAGVAGTSIRFLGTDGWSLTKEVGKTVGEGVEDAIDSIESVVSDVGGALGDAVEWIGDLF